MKTKPDLTNGYYAVRGSRDFYKGTSFRCNVWSENTHYFHDENYVDFVVYDGTLLMCMRNHISSEDNQPILKREGTVAVGLERNPLWEFVIGGVYSNGSISGDQIKLKIDGETLYVSYNGGATWTKVGSVGSTAVEPPKYTASVASVSSGTTADASVNVVNNDFKFTFSIPRGTDGVDGISKFKSTVFIRSNEKPDTPKGGSYKEPKPISVHNGKNWEDGIPEGKDILWASNYIFVSNGDYNNSDNIVWSDPVQMTDTSSFEVIYGIENANLTNLPDLPIKDGFSNENGWYDDAPSDNEIIYMATATCSNGIWSNWVVSKIKGEKGDNGGYDYVFKLTEENTAPNTPETSQEDNYILEDGWAQYPQTVTETFEYQWVSARHKVNNEWSAYSTPVLYNSYATEGIAPSAKFKSFAFCRTNNVWSATDTIPTGGTYEEPRPTNHGTIGGKPVKWEDTVPSGNGAIWMTTAVFDSKEHTKDTNKSPEWSIPIQWSDTANLQIEYSDKLACPGLKSLQDYYNDDPINFESNWRDDHKDSEGKYNWSDDVVNAIWMAIATMSNGIWSDWTVHKIKGEDGTNGTSLNIKGKKDSSEELPMEGNTLGDAYLIDGNLWVWDGDSWQDAGQIQGPSGTSMYLWVKYCTIDPTNSTNNNIVLLDTPSKYIGICTTTDSTAPTNKNSYTWTKWQGDDGWGYQYIYKLSKTNSTEDSENGRPKLPTGKPTGMDEGLPSDWSDNPRNVSEEFPYCWMCYSQSNANGEWSDWKGTRENQPALWAKWGVDGAPGESGAGYQQCFHLSAVDTEIFGDSGIISRPNEDGLNDWTESASSVSSSHPVEWRCDRYKMEGADQWSEWSAPHVFSHFGKNGEDGAGIEYVFLLVNNDVPEEAIKQIMHIDINTNDYQRDDYEPTTTYELPGTTYECKWTDNQSTVTAEKPFLYSSIRRKKKGQWQVFEEPVLWNQYVTNGLDGQMALAIKVWKRGNPTLQTNDKPGVAIYNLNEHTLKFTGNANGWSFDMPSHISNSTLYSYSAYITGTITENITINEADWKGPNIESVDGKDGSGQSATYITVYPDSILVNVDDDGKARFDQTITGYANYYYGTGKLDSTVTVSCDNNKIVCSKGANNSFTIAIPKDTVIGSNDFVTVTCKPDKSSVSSGGEDVNIYELSSTIPINKIASNDVYSLTVTPNQIIAPNSSDWSQDITCTVIKNGKECPASDKNVSVENLINGQPGTLSPYQGSTHKYTYTVNNNNFDDLSNELTFVLKINDISVAHQTVSLIKNGSNGNSVIGVYEYYLWTDKTTTPTGFTSSDVQIKDGVAQNIIVNGETWNANKPTEFSESLPYLWNVEVIKIGKENVYEYTVTSPSLISTSGRGIKSITEYYLRCNDASGITHTNEPWETYDINKHVPTEDNKYLWNYEHIIYTDGTDHKTPPTIVTFWNKGADGRSIADVIEYYLYTNSNNPPVPNWDDYQVTINESGITTSDLYNTDNTKWSKDDLPDTKGAYLWNVEVIVYKDAGDGYTHTSCILLSDMADKIESIQECYMIANTNTQVVFNKDINLIEWTGGTAEGGQWYIVNNPQYVPIPTTEFPYLWNAEKITYITGDVEYTSPICLGVLLKGDAGDNSYNLSVELSEDMYSVVIDKESRVSIDKYCFDQIISLYENGQETSGFHISWTNPQPDNIDISEDTKYNENNKKKFKITIKNSCKFTGNSLTLSCTCKTSDGKRQASKNCTIIALLEDNRYKLVCKPVRLIKKYNNKFVNGGSIACSIFNYNDVPVTELDGYLLWYTYDDVNYTEVQNFEIHANENKNWCKVYLVYGDEFNINKIRDYVLVEISTLPKPEISYTVTPNVIEYDVRNDVIVNNADHQLSHTFLYDGQMVKPAAVEVGYYTSDKFINENLTISDITAYGFDLQINNVLSQNAYFVKATYENTDGDEFVAIYPIQINKHDVNFVVTVNPDVWYLGKRIDRPNGEMKNSRTVAQQIHLNAYYDGNSVDISNISIDNELVSIIAAESVGNNRMYLTYEQQFNGEESYTDLLGKYDSGAVEKIKLTAMYKQMYADAEILLRPGIFEFSWSGTDEIGLFGKHTIRGFLYTVNDEVITESDLQAMSLSVKFYIDGKEYNGLSLQELASSGYDANDLGVFHEFSIRIYDNVNALIFINNITRIDIPDSPFESIPATVCVDSNVSYSVPSSLNNRNLSYSFSNNTSVNYNNNNGDSKIIFTKGSGGEVVTLTAIVQDDNRNTLYTYLKTVSTYVNGALGATGPQGPQGPQGLQGDTGNGISSITSGENGSIDITTTDNNKVSIDLPTQNSLTLYQRSATDPMILPVVSPWYYNHENKEWSGTILDNWHRAIPPRDGNPCYSVTYEWIGVPGDTITISPNDWLGPTRVTESLDGQPGATGAIIYPAGQWSPNVMYKKESDITPYVEYDNKYYICIGESQEDTEAEDICYLSPNVDADNWKLMNQFNSVFTKLLVAENGTIGAAVYSGDFMFSQHGIVKEWSEEELTARNSEDGDYKYFGLDWDSSDPINSLTIKSILENSKFVPNIVFDFKSGNGYLNRGDIKFNNGRVEAQNLIVHTNESDTQNINIKNAVGTYDFNVYEMTAFNINITQNDSITTEDRKRYMYLYVGSTLLNKTTSVSDIYNITITNNSNYGKYIYVNSADYLNLLRSKSVYIDVDTNTTTGSQISNSIVDEDAVSVKDASKIIYNSAEFDCIYIQPYQSIDLIYTNNRTNNISFGGASYTVMEGKFVIKSQNYSATKLPMLLNGSYYNVDILRQKYVNDVHNDINSENGILYIKEDGKYRFSIKESEEAIYNYGLRISNNVDSFEIVIINPVDDTETITVYQDQDNWNNFHQLVCSGQLSGQYMLKLSVHTLYSNTVDNATYYLCDPVSYNAM